MKKYIIAVFGLFAISFSLVGEASALTRVPDFLQRIKEIRQRGAHRSMIARDGATHILAPRGGIENKSYEANAIDFKVMLPGDFEKKSDTITWNSGSLVLSNGKTDITFEATGDICEGGRSSVSSCIQKIVNQWQMILGKGEVFQRKDLRYKKDKVSGDQNKTYGKYWAMRKGVVDLAYGVFIHPAYPNVWKITISDAQRNFISNIQKRERMFLSIFEAWNLVPNQVRSNLNTLRSLYGPTRTTPIFQKNNEATTTQGYGEVKTIYTTVVPLSFDLPVEYEKIEDLSLEEQGVMAFEAPDGSFIELSKTDIVCDYQSLSQIRWCLDMYTSDSYENFLMTEALGYRSVQTGLYSTVRLYLDPTSVERRTGKLFIASDGMSRKGYLYIPRPSTGEVWLMKIHTIRQNDSLLGSSVQIRQLTSSVRFE